ncbi:phage tail protein [Microvirga sp. STR05]|uniref:Phage tail protein n=1 Tax=Hymenobacter duratus TaxID=2771356 RepID=A0ABR8JC54_9BACT|nr:tail fiber protein [Hymenobacter duratus]MBD2714351.1 phage tail protein [Hymenobacter duratus]MBR7949254.1 phage tail protein [Microvirga sp. STR05]
MEPMLGEIRAVAFPFAPRDWAICDGSLLQIRTNTALFALLGVQFGGDGISTFGLPDLRGRAVVNAGTGAGLSPYNVGAKLGQEAVPLDVTQMPLHTHTLGNVKVNPADPNVSSPGQAFLSNASKAQYGETAGANTTMAAGSVQGTGAPLGSSQPHSNMQPYLVLNYIIATQGIFPQRP